MPEHNTGQMGGTMRLGKRKTVFNAKTCITSKSSQTITCYHGYRIVLSFRQDSLIKFRNDALDSSCIFEL